MDTVFGQRDVHCAGKKPGAASIVKQLVLTTSERRNRLIIKEVTSMAVFYLLHQLAYRSAALGLALCQLRILPATSRDNQQQASKEARYVST